jgi:transcriptional antiterminator RfaH
MPILSKEPGIYPQNLLEPNPPEEMSGSAGLWWAAYTKTRQEKALARQLAKQQIAHFLPLVPHTRVGGGRKWQSFIPLFPSYVFLFGSETDRHSALGTNRIVSVITVKDQQQLYLDLVQIKRLIDSNAPLTIERRLEAGRLVRVKNGALQGIEGVVTRRRSGDRLLVAVHLMQQGVSLSIDDFQVEPID